MLRRGGRGRDPSRRRCRRLNTSSPRRRQASPSLSLGPQLPDLLAASGRLHSNLFYAGGHGPGPGGFVPGEGERSSSVLLSIWAVPGSSSCPGMDGAGLLFFLYYTQISKVALTALCYHASTLMLSTASMMESSASMLSFGVACDELVMISSVGKRHIVGAQANLIRTLQVKLQMLNLMKTKWHTLVQENFFVGRISTNCFSQMAAMH
ncbi:uncharacterized protein [Triticum aestivum]|uniref:uncharacterized protein n=1 Tax=Triticum aestivum TaxID=4565 RepID=UPI001D014947|nr:uncharacterized protein LOC123080837 [Triticum aestivum]